jgi:hypothetical protein
MSLKEEAGITNHRFDETVYVPIRFHAVSDLEGNGRIDFDRILDQLCALNGNFAEQNIQFYLKDGVVNEINDNTIYNNPSSAAGTSKMVVRKNADGKNAINVFITDQAATGGEGTTLGYYDFNPDLVVIKKSVFQSQNNIGFVLGHELGHFFSLPHTFRGWENAPWDGGDVTQFSPNSSILNELVDGSNCDNAGDLICDTPPDYNLGFGWDGCRDYDGGAKDPNGELLDPDESNFMGYFIGCENYLFSEDQKAIIASDYESPRRGYLRVPYIPDDEPITELPTLQSPADDSTTPFFNGVELSWTEVDKATTYLVELTKGLFRSYYHVSGTKLFLTDLDPDKIYRWKVRPYNEISTCTDFSEVFSFRTGDMTSSTSDIDFIQEHISVYPNPITSNVINISFGEELTGKFNVELKDINGRMHYTQKVDAIDYAIDNLGLHSGFYILTFRQGETIISKKIVVND